MRLVGAAALSAVMLFIPDVAQAGDLRIPRCTLADAIDLIARKTGASIGTANPALLHQAIPPIKVSGSVEQMLRMVLGDEAVLRRFGRNDWLIVSIRKRSEPTKAAGIDRLEVPSAQPIIITASRRDASLAGAAFAVRTVSGAEVSRAAALEGSGAITGRVALVNSTHLGPGRDKLFVRGVADSSFAGTRAGTVAIYLGEQRVTYRAPDPGLLPFDLAQIEVLPGPHGTLYGAGALGGLIRLQPNAPDRLHSEGASWGGLSATAHGAPGFDIGALANVPLSGGDGAIRVLGYAVSAGGYIDDPARAAVDVNRVKTLGGRVGLRWELGDWTADLSAVGQDIRARDAQYAQSGLAGALERRVGKAEPAGDRLLLGSGTMRRDNGVTHLAVTFGMVRQRLRESYAAETLGGKNVLYEQADTSTLLSADARIWRDEANSGVGWLIGLNALSSKADQSRNVRPYSSNDFVIVKNNNVEMNAYAEGVLRIAGGFDMVLGGRISHISLGGLATGKLDSFYFSRDTDPVEVHRAQSRFLPSISGNLDIGGGARLFARYELGYRPGGVASGVTVRRFASDRIGTLEAGVRNGRLGPVVFDATLAWSNWNNVQADLLTPTGITITENVGDAHILSMDVAARVSLTQRLEVEGAGMLVRQGLDAIPYLRGGSGSLPDAPKVSIRGAMQYEIPVGRLQRLTTKALLSYEGISHLGAGEALDLQQGPVIRLDVSSHLSTGVGDVSLSVENLLDAHGNRFALGNPFTLSAGGQNTRQRPRTVRIGIERAF